MQLHNDLCCYTILHTNETKYFVILYIYKYCYTLRINCFNMNWYNNIKESIVHQMKKNNKLDLLNNVIKDKNIFIK